MLIGTQTHIDIQRETDRERKLEQQTDRGW